MRSLFQDKYDNLLVVEKTEEDRVFNTPTKEGINPNESLSTPPITPFSDDDSPLRSRTVTSDNDLASSTTDGSTIDMPTTLATMGMEGTKLLQQVLGMAEEYGGTCGILEEFSSLGLKTITEEKSVHVDGSHWGISPAKDTDEGADDDTLGSDPHEDFELVLQDKFESDEPLFCQPCAGIIPIDISDFKDNRKMKFWKRKSSSSVFVPSEKKSKIKLKSFRLVHHNSNRERRQKKDAVKSPPNKKGKWKAATCPKTKRVYYYHSKTKEVTWNRPKSFTEWKVLKNDKNILFYNVITKESTSEMPVGFRVWREAVDTTSPQGKNYYYNILTKETTWTMPKEMIEIEKEQDKKEYETLTMKKKLQDLVLGEEDEDETPQNGPSPTSSESQPSSTLNLVKNTPSFFPGESEVDNQRPSTPTEGEKKLCTILQNYCSDDIDIQNDLLRFCKGNETAIVKDLDSIIESTPYDEIGATVRSYVKITVESMKNMPMDEIRMATKKVTAFKLPKVDNSSSKDMNRVNTYCSAYSMTSRAMSHTTTKSAMTNVTDATNRVNNTSGHVGIQSQIAFHTIQEYSFDNDCDTETEGNEMISRVDVDVKAVLGDDGLSKKAEIFDNKRKEENEFRVKMDMKVEQVKKIIATTPNPEKKGPNNDTTTKRSISDAHESHCITDFQNRSDNGSWNDHGDDVSELSDSFSPAKSKRAAKEKKIAAEKEISNNKVVHDIHQVLHQSKSVGSKKMKPKIVNPPVSHYVSTALSSPHDKIEYVELPRIHRKSTKDGDSLSSWEDTITTADSK